MIRELFARQGMLSAEESETRETEDTSRQEEVLERAGLTLEGWLRMWQ